MIFKNKTNFDNLNKYQIQSVLPFFVFLTFIIKHKND